MSIGNDIRPVEARRNRRAENGSGWGYIGEGAPSKRSGEQCMLSQYKLPLVGSGAEPRKIWIKEQKSRHDGLSDNVLF